MPEINIALIVLIFLYLRWARVDISGLRIYLPLTVTVAIFMFTVSIVFPDRDPSFHPFHAGITFYPEALFWTFASYWRLMAMLFGTIQYFSTNRERETLVAIRSAASPSRSPTSSAWPCGLPACSWRTCGSSARQSEPAASMNPPSPYVTGPSSTRCT